MRVLWMAGAVLAAGCCLAPAAGFAAPSKSEAAIAALIERERKALEAHDLDAVMACYAPGDALRVFDVVPPREYKGWEAYKKSWAEVLAMFPGPLEDTRSEVSIAVDHALGYATYIDTTQFATKDGAGPKVVVRVTDVYRKIAGKWLIVHEHISVPVDLATGKADLLSEP